MKTKFCNRCQTTKPYSDFGGKKCEKQSRCKICIREVNKIESAEYRRMIEIKKREQPKYYGSE